MVDVNFRLNSALIVLNSLSQRTLLKKAITDLGVEPKRIQVAYDFETAASLIEKNKFNLIISGNDLGKGKTALNLLDCVNLTHEPFERIFVQISEQVCPLLIAEFYEGYGDVFIVMPFTFESILKDIKSKLGLKQGLTKNDRLFQKTQRQLTHGTVENAQFIITQMKEQGVDCNVVEAMLAQYQGDYLKSWDSLKCLNHTTIQGYINLVTFIYGAFHAREYEMAYAVSKRLLEEFPLSNRHHLILIRILLATKRFAEIEELASEYAKKENCTKDNLKAMAASLVVAGRELQSSEGKDPKSYFMRACKLCDNDHSIVLTVVKEFVSLGDFETAKEIGQRYSSEDPFHEIEVMRSYSNIQDILFIGLKYMREKRVSKRFFEYLIGCCVEIGKSPDSLVQQAISCYPESRNDFLAFSQS